MKSQLNQAWARHYRLVGTFTWHSSDNWPNFNVSMDMLETGQIVPEVVGK